MTQNKKMYMWDLRSDLPGYQSLWWVCDHPLHRNWLFACIIHFVFSFQYIMACFQFSTMESSNKFMHFKVSSLNLNFARKIKIILYIFMFSKESWLTHHNNPQSLCLISFSYINKIYLSNPLHKKEGRGQILFLLLPLLYHVSVNQSSKNLSIYYLPTIH